MNNAFAALALGAALLPLRAHADGLTLGGYVDAGFAKAQGDGTSFRPGDTRLPADYVVDTFAPAVNSRGDVASTDAGSRFVNGFSPRSVGIGGNGSFLLNTLDLDGRYDVPGAPVLVFARVQLLPRFSGTGDASSIQVEQAFGRVAPLKDREWMIFAGKFDSVFGIEYLETEAPLRTGITPSLIARYTTGQGLGVKTFYRVQLPALLSSVSLNVAATTAGTMVESLQGPDGTTTGTPVGSARLGWELDLPGAQLKFGGSALYGPRNDQPDPHVMQKAVGADVRVNVGPFSLAGEAVRLLEDAGTVAGKTTGTGTYDFASGFRVTGGYAIASWTFDLGDGAFRKLTPYIRYERRIASFDGFQTITVDRITGGGRLDLFGSLALKAEYLANGEVSGAPQVSNNVATASAVFSF